LSAFTPNDNQVLIKTNGLSAGTYMALVVSNKGKQMFTLHKL